MFPSCDQSFRSDALLFATVFLFDEVEGDVSERGHIGRRMIFADTAFVFSKRHIENPMDFIFNSPVTAYSVSYLLGIGWQAADEIAAFYRGFAFTRACCFYQGNRA